MPVSALPSSTSVQPGRWLAAQGRLPLAFMALSLAWLAAGATLLAVQPGLLALPHMHPWVVALTHAWVLGFLVTAACGAVYQLAPVALGTTLWSERRGWWHFGLHAAGVPGMVYAFWHWDMVLLGHAGFLVLVGTALFAENTWRTVARSGKRDTTAWSIALAAGWLLLTALAGLTLAANRFWGFIPMDPLALLRAHAHLGLIGFFVTLLQGVSFTLIPMFTLAEVRSWRLVKAGLWCGQLGLVGLVAALAFHATWATFAFALLILVGFVCSGRALFSTLANRKKRLLGPGLAAFLRGLAVLGIAAVAGAALAWPRSPWGSASGGFGAVPYAILAVAGGLLPAVTGMLCKIIPFLTWMRAYGPKVGHSPTPPASSLIHPGLERWALIAQAAALAPLLAGSWLSNEWLLCAGAWLLAGGVALFLGAMASVLSHLWHPSAALAMLRSEVRT
jgi:hypothetical protein